MRSIVPSFAQRSLGFVANGFNKFTAAAAALFLALFAALPASATSAGAAMAAELGGGKAEVLSVIVILAAIVGVIILWKYVRRAG